MNSTFYIFYPPFFTLASKFLWQPQNLAQKTAHGILALSKFTCRLHKGRYLILQPRLNYVWTVAIIFIQLWQFTEVVRPVLKTPQQFPPMLAMPMTSASGEEWARARGSRPLRLPLRMGGATMKGDAEPLRHLARWRPPWLLAPAGFGTAAAAGKGFFASFGACAAGDSARPPTERRISGSRRCLSQRKARRVS